MMHLQWEKVIGLCVLLVAVGHSDSISFKVSCRDLIPREQDQDDKPDPFVKVRYKDYEDKTDYLDNNQYPQWSKIFTLEYDRNSNKPFEFELREEDGGPDDGMGKIFVHPNQILGGVERVVWKDGNYVGKIRFTST